MLAKAYFKIFPKNQNLLLLIDSQVWRLVVIETCTGNHYFPCFLPIRIIDMEESQCGTVIIHSEGACDTARHLPSYQREPNPEQS